MSRLIAIILALCITSVASAQPLTTKPNLINMMVTPCAANTLIIGNGATAAPLCGPTLGTGIATALGVNVGTAGAPVINGGALGTPSSGTGTNLTGIPTTALTGATLAAQEPAHTGDVTNSAGSLALAYANVVPANKGGYDQTAFSVYTATPIACSTPGNATFTVNASRSKTQGKLTCVSLDITVASNTTGSGTINVKVPVLPQSAGSLAGKEIASTGKAVNAGFQASAATFNFSDVSGLNICTAGFEIVASGCYESQ
jgi:hypothetical protein